MKYVYKDDDGEWVTRDITPEMAEMLMDFWGLPGDDNA